MLTGACVEGESATPRQPTESLSVGHLTHPPEPEDITEAGEKTPCVRISCFLVPHPLTKPALLYVLQQTPCEEPDF